MKPITTPTLVATPLPPVNLMYGDQQWRIIVNKPDKICVVMLNPSNLHKSITQVPLIKESKRPIEKPLILPIWVIAFAAPILPEP